MHDASSSTDDRDAVTQRFDFREHVTRQQDGATSVSLGSHVVLEPRFHEGIETASRLVEQQELDFRGERCDQHDLLSIALRIAPSLARGIELELLDECVASSGIKSSAQPAEQVDDLASAQLRPEIDVTGDIRETSMQGGRVAPRIAAEENDVATIRSQQAERHAQRCRLPGSIRSEEAVDLALRHREVKGVKGQRAAEPLGNRAHAQDARHIDHFAR